MAGGNAPVHAESAVEKTDVFTEKYLVFTVREKRYAFPSRLIGEVAALEKVFPLPLLPGYVRGIINRYSVPYALIDLGVLLFENDPAAASPFAKLVVLKEEVDKLAFLIDDITDIADISPADLIKVEDEGDAAGTLISASFEWKGSAVFCVGLEELARRIRKDFEG